MSKQYPQNISASVSVRLQNLSKQRGEDFQLVLSRYAIERLVYRLSFSQHSARFIIKGATLFHLWAESTSAHPYRTTRDIDFLAHGNNAVESLVAVFTDVCNMLNAV